MKRKTAIRISPEMRRLSRYVAGAVSTPLPDRVVERIKLHLLDTLSAMISGTKLAAGREAIKYVRSQGGKPEAAIVGTRIVTSAPLAALANGMLTHADESDDTHPASNTHPGRGVVPAVLAIGERNGLSGVSVLRAMNIGYDVCARLPLALQPMPLMRSGHYTGAFGAVFGAAAGAAALLRLTPLQVRHAISLTAQQSAGLTLVLRGEDHIEKAFAGGGMPAHNGTVAALMAASGFTGVEDIFTGENNFLSTFSSEPKRSELTRGLGKDYQVLQCAIKCWSSGGPTQGPLHVLKNLIDRHGVTAKDVKEVVVRMPDKELEIVNNRDMPNICVQHLLAVMLLDGNLSFAATHDSARMSDPRVLALRKRIKAVGDPRLTDKLRRWRCIMEIALKDGRVITDRTMAAKGSFENPVTREEAEIKALDLMAPVLGQSRARAIIATIWDFENIRNVRALRKLTASAGRAEKSSLS